MTRMNKPGLRELALGLLVSGLAACGGEAEEESTVVVTDSVAPVAAPVAATTGMIDPDQATREELVAAGVDAALADSLIAGRPYANMTEVDAVLASVPESQRDQIYARVWKP